MKIFNLLILNTNVSSNIMFTSYKKVNIKANGATLTNSLRFRHSHADGISFIHKTNIHLAVAQRPRNFHISQWCYEIINIVYKTKHVFLIAVNLT